MTKQSKSVFQAALTTLLNDNTTADITPAKHRTVETNLSDSVGFLSDTNTWEKGVKHTPTVSTTTSSFTMSADVYHYVFNGASAGDWDLPAGVDGMTFVITNATSSYTLTINPDGSEVILGTDPLVIAAEQTATIRWVNSISKWVYDYTDSGSAGNSGLLKKEVEISVVQAQSLHTTSVEIIAAPGADSFINLIRASASINYNSAAYNDSTLNLRYNDVTSVLSLGSGLVNQTNDAFSVASPSGSSVNTNINENITLDASANLGTSGNSTIKIVVYYTIESL